MFQSINLRNELLILVLLFGLTSLSCNTRLLVKSKNIIYSQKGAIVFIDNESRTYRNLESGDVFTDSLISDFFIPYKFERKIISKKDLEKVFLAHNEAKVSFVYLIRDCEQVERKSSIEKECLEFKMDKDIDDYLKSNRLFVLPVELRYTLSNIDREYLSLHKDISLQYKGHSFKVVFNPGSYEVLQMLVLENDWTK